MTTESLFEGILNDGLNERIRRERRYFIEEIKRKVKTLMESEVDGKDIAKDLLEYLTKIEVDLTMRFNPFEH